MGRAAFTIRTTDCCASVLDRFAGSEFFPEKGPGGDSARGPAGIDTVLPGSEPCSVSDLAQERSQAEPEVILHEVWTQLSVPDRQRFGHCFSFMVLKALGLRPCSAKEVES